jgi:hypothetical protein
LEDLTMKRIVFPAVILAVAASIAAVAIAQANPDRAHASRVAKVAVATGSSSTPHRPDTTSAGAPNVACHVGFVALVIQ